MLSGSAQSASSCTASTCSTKPSVPHILTSPSPHQRSEYFSYLDGDRELPTLVGTGAEDYAGTSWGIRNESAILYQGVPFADNDNMRFCFYRYHIPDPVYFRRDIRMTAQQIGLIEKDDPLVHERNSDLPSRARVG